MPEDETTTQDPGAQPDQKSAEPSGQEDSQAPGRSDSAGSELGRPRPEDIAALDYYIESLRLTVPDLSEKVMIFIDWAYVVNGARDLGETRLIDIPKFVAKLSGRRRLIRTYLYDGRIDNPPNENWRNRQQAQQRLESAMAILPAIEFRWGRLQFSGGQPRQKGVDVLLSLDMLRFALKSNYDKAILVSGDGDFADIVKMVKDEGRTVEVAMFHQSRAWALLQAADVWVKLDRDFLEDCWLPERESTQ